MLVGFFAAGRDGNALAPTPRLADDCTREGAGDARAELEFDDEAAAAGRRASQLGVGAGLALPLDDDPLAADSDGKDEVAACLGAEPDEPAAVPHDLGCAAPWLRPDCAVELLSFNTLLVPTPWPSTPAAVVALAPVGPGNVG